MLAGLAAALFGGPTARVWRCGLIVFAIAFGMMVLIDQHRLQPWAYQFALIALLLVLVPGDRAVALVRVLTVGIYLHSALSKLDYSFLATNGQYLLSGLTDVAGVKLSRAPETVRLWLAALLPVSELLVAIGLCFRRTLRWAVIASVLMHAALIVALGPWSLDHELPVLIWNGYFIVQNIVLFGFNREPASFRPLFQPADEIDREYAATSFRSWSARGIVGLAILLPFLQPFGFFDVWPSWAVYASQPARARIIVARDAIDKLPTRPSAIRDVRRSTVEGPRILRVDRWSLDATKAPVYPGQRFEIGVAIALADRFELGDGIQVQLDSAANRWTGQRSSRTISGIEAIRQEAERYRLNAFPSRTPLTRTGDDVRTGPVANEPAAR